MRTNVCKMNLCNESTCVRMSVVTCTRGIAAIIAIHVHHYACTSDMLDLATRSGSIFLGCTHIYTRMCLNLPQTLQCALLMDTHTHSLTHTHTHTHKACLLTRHNDLSIFLFHDTHTGKCVSLPWTWSYAFFMPTNLQIHSKIALSWDVFMRPHIMHLQWPW